MADQCERSRSCLLTVNTDRIEADLPASIRLKAAAGPETNAPSTHADARPVRSGALAYGQLPVNFAPSAPSVVGTDANAVLFASANTQDALVPLSFGPAIPGWFV